MTVRRKNGISAAEYVTLNVSNLLQSLPGFIDTNQSKSLSWTQWSAIAVFVL